MTISLSEDEAAWLAQQAAAQGMTPETLVLKMLEDERQSLERLRALIDEGVASGDFIDADDAYFAELRARIGTRTAAE
jgi:hypothetical protein